MNGVKQTYVCIEEDELVWLKFNEARLHAMKSPPIEKINSIRSDIEHQLKEKLARMDRRQIEYQQYVYDLNGTLRSLEIENQHRFSQQNQKIDLIRKEYFTLLRMERDEYLSIFECQEKKLTDLIQAEKRELHKAEINLQNKINSLFIDNKKPEKVKNFTNELAILIQETFKIPHQQFAPGKFEQITNQLQTAIEDINTGFFETALSAGRNAYWQLIELRSNVLQQEHEFITLFAVIMEVLDYLTVKAELNRKRKLSFGKEENKKEIEIDIDYWTHGQLTKYEHEIKSYYNNLLKNEKNISIEQLKKLIKEIEKIEISFNKIMENARENILSSQLRANVALKSVQALKEELFTVADSAYEGNDPRNAYYVKLKNRTGNEIVTVIKPVAGEFGKNELEFNFYDNKIVNQDVLNERVLEIINVLNRHGLGIGKLQTINSIAKPQFIDTEKVRKGRISYYRTKNKP